MFFSKCCEVRGGLKNCVARLSEDRWILHASAVASDNVASATLRHRTEQHMCLRVFATSTASGSRYYLACLVLNTRARITKSGDPMDCAIDHRGVLPQSNAARRPLLHIPLL